MVRSVMMVTGVVLGNIQSYPCSQTVSAVPTNVLLCGPWLHSSELQLKASQACIHTSSHASEVL